MQKKVDPQLELFADGVVNFYNGMSPHAQASWEYTYDLEHDDWLIKIKGFGQAKLIHCRDWHRVVDELNRTLGVFLSEFMQKEANSKAQTAYQAAEEQRRREEAARRKAEDEKRNKEHQQNKSEWWKQSFQYSQFDFNAHDWEKIYGEFNNGPKVKKSKPSPVYNEYLLRLKKLCEPGLHNNSVISVKATTWLNEQNAAAFYIDDVSMKRLIILCHPDKHGQSKESVEITQWLLKKR